MGFALDHLAVWVDPVPRDGPEQMACDEAMLALAEEPVLRVFRWSEPWVSTGYFTPWQDACTARPGWPVCRRWTGGGVVVHEDDFTFALIAPRGTGWAGLRPADSYRILHGAVVEALRSVGVEAALFEGPPVGGPQCFAGPVRHDIVAGGRKIAGGAQRRTKRGLLHQGSVQGAGLARDFAAVLAATLAAETAPCSPPPALEETLAHLVRQKYGREDFVRINGR